MIVTTTAIVGMESLMLIRKPCYQIEGGRLKDPCLGIMSS